MRYDFEFQKIYWKVAVRLFLEETWILFKYYMKMCLVLLLFATPFCYFQVHYNLADWFMYPVAVVGAIVALLVVKRPKREDGSYL